MMNRRFFLKSSILGSTGITLFPGLTLHAADPQETWSISPITDKSGIYTERGGTMAYLDTPEGIITVDSQFPEQARNFIEVIHKQFSKAPVLLINTHHHGDHTAGNIAFKGLVRDVVAHENSARYQRIVAEERGTLDQQLFPTITFRDSWSSEVGGLKITARHFGPAHTSGDSVIHFVDAGVVHMGDLVFNRRHPYIDRGAGASIENWSRALNQVSDLFGDQVTYVFGHAGEGFPVTGKSADLKQMAAYLDALLNTAWRFLREGKDKTSLSEAGPMKGFENYSGNRLAINLETAWDELSEGNS